ncbi:MAG: ribonuclease III [Bacteroidia bacterium]|nr:ribonuclease III [Bacteroidia bacterium]MDW8345414.1 ribonuclease III [Bacteroidia bacterium]
MIRLLQRLYLKYFVKKSDLFNFVYRLTGHTPQNLDLFKLAFTHVSAIKANSKEQVAANSNERLEFLGDAVLSSIIAEVLYHKYPLKTEGFLTELRSKIVNRDALDALALKLNFDAFINYRKDKVPNARNLYGNCFEAFIGALYLDAGYETTKKFVVHRLLTYWIDIEKLSVTDTNFKSKLIEYAQEHKMILPFFEVIEKRQNGNQMLYVVQVTLGSLTAIGIDNVKKKAEQLAAKQALLKIQQGET